VPAIRSVAKVVTSQHPELSHDDLLVLVDALWAAPVHERRTVAVELLDIYHDRLRGEDVGPLERVLRKSRTWALVDPRAASVVGRLAEHHPEVGIVLGEPQACSSAKAATAATRAVGQHPLDPTALAEISAWCREAGAKGIADNHLAAPSHQTPDE
jgi:DNA alkylation repair enzyme